ncbi:MAG: transporter substrate-binding domain-containing protein [Ruminococcaceae bacterium]|nr:transporter substrate-binding domain-containing protein [Oscillospiraceae bacterium]
MKRVLSIILSLAIIISSFAFVFADGVDGPMQKAKIKVGVSADYMPFEYYDESGNMTGFSIDLMNYIGERIGYDVEYVNIPFEEILTSVINGDVDCAISTISVTQERKQYVDYTREYLKTNNITVINGQKSVKFGESYAVVFKKGLGEAPYKESPLTEKEALYVKVNQAITDLSHDRTVTKLIEKYELNKPITDDGEYVEYSAVISGGDPGAMTSATSNPASDWAIADIEKAKALNIISGNYNFPGNITREGFCELVYNYVSEFGKLPSDDGHIVFADTDNMKARILNTMGIIKGKSETQFAPNDLLTREEAATILNRLINIVHPDLASTELYFEFADSTQISDWAMSAIQRICNIGIMKGVGNNSFAPKDNYTTEQAIATLVRVYASSGISKSDDMTFADKLKAQMPTGSNYMFSPLSIKMAFAMAANGAEGNTKTEILNALDIENLDEYNEYAKKLIEGYQKADILKLDIANALWINETNTTQKFSEKYQNTLKNFYDAQVNGSTRDKIAGEINSWVKEKTNDKIDSIISDELAKDERFIMALLNAVYFKAVWQNEFDEDATKKDTFTDRNGVEKQTDFMNETAYYGYYNENGTEVLALPYKNRVYDETAGEMLSYDFDVSMYLVRGDYSENILSSLIENNSFKNRRIKLSIPKFESRFDTSLINLMNNLGVVDAFEEEKADFRKMFDKGNMYLMAALHKTYIKVDEKGTEAAAVTALAGGTSSVPPEPIVVKFDTPFTYVIRDDANGEILFMGEYAFVE